jgi:hypothetical protein
LFVPDLGRGGAVQRPVQLSVAAAVALHAASLIAGPFRYRPHACKSREGAFGFESGDVGCFTGRIPMNVATRRLQH